ncbi:hypothetical protein F5B18DRAFT_608865 [Nemania serpens]|nr:hypothetical protein F5B18DRAFT_608865 [Nemania serpens]
MCSWDVRLKDSTETPMELFVRILRREGYFRALALLVASRGLGVAPCGNKCGNGRQSPRPFRSCVVLAGFQENACASCVWHSHAARCRHHVWVYRAGVGSNGRPAKPGR